MSGESKKGGKPSKESKKWFFWTTWRGLACEKIIMTKEWIGLEEKQKNDELDFEGFFVFLKQREEKAKGRKTTNEKKKEKAKGRTKQREEQIK